MPRKNEDERLKELCRIEREYWNKGILPGGMDEVGRGPLAGPVVAGAVILPKDCEILYLNDSKQLSEKKREELYDEILSKAVAAAVGYASPARIDEINILQATYEAMREAVAGLSVKPDFLLNDAVRIPALDIPKLPIIKGDAKSVSIAAASILAKVTRDRLMKEYDRNSGISEIDDLFAFLAEQDRINEAAFDTMRKEKADMQTSLDQIRNAHDETMQQVERLAYSRKNEVDPYDYEDFKNGLKFLTEREKEILDLYIAGKTVKEIVALTGLKESTIRFHNRNIYTKLNVHSLKQLLRYAANMKQEEGERGKTNGIS